MSKRAASPPDHDAARELQLYVENDGDLYRQQGEPILKNLATKKARGVYDHEKAVKLYMYLMENGAKKYAREVGGDARNWATVFSVPTRRAAAEEFAGRFERTWESGELHYLLPKKYQVAAARRKLLASPLIEGIRCGKVRASKVCTRKAGHAGPCRDEAAKIVERVEQANLAEVAERAANDYSNPGALSGIDRYLADTAGARSGVPLYAREDARRGSPSYENYRGLQITCGDDGSCRIHRMDGSFVQDAESVESARRTVDAMLGD